LFIKERKEKKSSVFVVECGGYIPFQYTFVDPIDTLVE
jgi:hypothetical protein